MFIRLFSLKFRLLRRLPSKKNRVYLVESAAGRFVLKLYRAPHHLNSAREHQVLLRACRCGVAVPRPCAFIEGKALLMEHIPGENLCDLLNRRCLEEHAEKLAGWFAAFHHCFRHGGGKTLLRGDSNLRNFVMRGNGTLYGIDFEEAAPGHPLRDLGRICASILDTEPKFTAEKAALCRRLIACYGGLTGQEGLEPRLIAETVVALREASRRRPRQRDYLLEQAARLEQGRLEYYLNPLISYLP